MPKAIFKGSLSFGLVNIPIKVYPAVKSKRVAFRLLHKKCHTPLQHKRWCPHCGESVGIEEVVRGLPICEGKFAIFSEGELEQLLEQLQLKTVKAIEIVGFADAGEIDPLFFENSYWLEPEEGGEKAYALLREILARTGKVAVGKVVMRGKEYVVVVRAYQNALLMHALYYSDEVVSPELLENLKKVVVVREAELKMGQMLIEQLAMQFKPEEFQDRYRQAVMELARKKVEGELVSVERRKEVEATLDLMKALEASLEEAKKKKVVQVQSA